MLVCAQCHHPSPLERRKSQDRTSLKQSLMFWGDGPSALSGRACPEPEAKHMELRDYPAFHSSPHPMWTFRVPRLCPCEWGAHPALHPSSQGKALTDMKQISEHGREETYGLGGLGIFPQYPQILVPWQSSSWVSLSRRRALKEAV